MAASVYTSLLIQADNKHHAKAHRSSIDRDVIAAVAIDDHDRTVIQSSDPEALRVLAAALIEAADKADALLAEATS